MNTNTTTTKPTTTTAYSYCRFSTPEQLKGDSLRRQLEASAAYAKSQGWTLDNSLRDLGVSAFKKRNATHGALSKFLESVKDGTVKPGSVLIVEHFDRLSRATITDAMQQFLGLLSSGINVVTLTDKKLYTKQTVDASPTDLVISLMFMMKAHDESKVKSIRVGEAWDTKRNKARNGIKLSAKCPAWLEMKEDRSGFNVIEDKANLIRHIYKLGISGLGPVSIAKKLNQDKVKPLSHRVKHWTFSTVLFYMTSRLTLGEYQPCKMINSRAKASGEPIKDYYPAIVTEGEWYKLQSVINNRKKNTKGRTGNGLANLFGRLLTDADHGGVMVLSQKRKTSINMISINAIHGSIPYRGHAFPYPAFEKAFLNWVSEIKLDTVSSTASRLPQLHNELNSIDNKLAKLKAKAIAGELSDTALEVMGEYDKKRKAIANDIELEKAKENAPTTNTSDIASLVKRMDSMTTDERMEIRQQLKAAIANVVKSIKVHIRYNDEYNPATPRKCIAITQFTDGTFRYLYVRCQRAKEPFSKSLTYRNEFPIWKEMADLNYWE